VLNEYSEVSSQLEAAMSEWEEAQEALEALKL
jgi:hypothetical protein